MVGIGLDENMDVAPARIGQRDDDEADHGTAPNQDGDSWFVRDDQPGSYYNSAESERDDAAGHANTRQGCVT